MKKDEIDLKLTVEEPTKKEETPKVKVEDAKLLYPTDMVENFERMQSGDALDIHALRKKYPGYRFRYINKSWRMKEGRMGAWFSLDSAENKPVGDLDIAYMPEDMAIKRNLNRIRKGMKGIIDEEEFQEEIVKKIYKDSGGTVRAVVNGNDSMKGQPLKSMFVMAETIK